MTPSERGLGMRFSRRNFLRYSGASAAGLVLAACGTSEPVHPVPTVERKEHSIEGAIYKNGKTEGWVVKANQLCWLPNLEEYLYLTKASKFGRFVQPGDAPDLFKNPERPVEQYTADPWSGLLKENKGEGAVFFFGFLDEENGAVDGTRAGEGTFATLRGPDGLQKNKIDFNRSFFYPFGVKWPNKYSLKDTAKDPRILTPDAIATFGELRKKFWWM